MRRTSALVLAGALALLGVILLAGAVVGDGSAGPRLFLAVLGVFLLAQVYVVGQVRLARPDGAARTSLQTGPDGPTLVVGLRPTTPRVTVVTGLSGAVVFLAAVLGVGVSHGGLLFVPFVLLFAVLVPVGLRALRGRPRLEISARSLAYHGWSLDSRLGWADVVSVALEPGRRPRLVVLGRVGARSWSLGDRRFLLRLEPLPRHPQIAVFALSLDQPQRVTRLLQSFAALDEVTRAGLIGPEGVSHLSGPGS